MFSASKRILSLYMLFTLCFMAVLARIVYISYSTYADASQARSGRTVTVGETRGKIYDRNKSLLVDSENRLVAAVTPVALSRKYLGDAITSEAFNEKVKNGFPFVLPVTEYIDNELVKTFRVPVRYGGKSLASHVVGYTDGDGRGVTGAEKAFDSVLQGYGGRLTVTFETDALGRVLTGTDKIVKDDNFNSQGGVLLTIDSRIQELTEEALKKSSIESGCAVVMHIDSGDVVSLASVPDINPDNIEESMNKENSPFLNKALSSYSAGSVFKSILAAFALENGISREFSHNCKGSITVGGKKYICYGETVHGKLNMAGALQKSCNTYFIKLMEAVDAEEFLDFCRELGFGSSIRLCDGIETEPGLLPDMFSLSMEGNRANFAFGQGELLVTPVHMLKAYHVLAMGTLAEPGLLHGFCDEKGKISLEGKKTPVRLLSENTVNMMRELLFLVTEEGIATNAKSSLMKLAGKTGTAESGVYNENGEEIYRTWFVGFYPANNPHYIVAILNEDGKGGNTDCAPVFKNICEWIACNSLREKN